ncbi:MAG TPA: stage II sporulation protein M [Candidatus Nanoarchaeia archaeon]|nr:stage II sporulation protein M [Candidatus Nanoarchaeia archaeon]
MVLDWLINIHRAEEHPERMLFLGFFYSSVAVALALFIFPREAGAVMLVLTVAAFMPIMLNLMKVESLRDKESKFLVKQHWPALKLFVFMFAGMLLAYTTWFLLLPTEIGANLFSMQLDTITSRGVELGAVTGGGGFLSIFLNNIKVLVIGILLALVFGAGAIFILDWNATVLAALLGGTLKHSLDISVARYLIHGIPEISAYFIGGLAGGIISIGIVRHKLGTKNFSKTLMDSGELILLAVFVLLIAAILEVWVSPLI